MFDGHWLTAARHPASQVQLAHLVGVHHLDWKNVAWTETVGCGDRKKESRRIDSRAESHASLK